MFFFTPFVVLSSLGLGAIIGEAHGGPSRTRIRTLESRNATIRQVFALKDMYKGASFLNDWNFFSGADPTHGSVKYQSKADAMRKGLAFVQEDGTTVLAVDDKTVLSLGAKRDSVRISTKKTYNGGLFIADFFAMPHGCSVWPAYWSVGPNWPTGGEIDVVEGVHNQATNQYTLHTKSGCTLSIGNKKALGQVLNKQCASSNGNNAGCSFRDTDSRTYGEGFNRVGGGVYAHLWDSTGIKVWHFARTEIPADIVAKKPNPASWGTPVALWAAATCDMGQHFFDQTLVLDTTLCGDFAGPTYAGAGCPGTCAQAVTDPENYQFAKWKLNYIAVYQ